MYKTFIYLFTVAKTDVNSKENPVDVINENKKTKNNKHAVLDAKILRVVEYVKKSYSFDDASDMTSTVGLRTVKVSSNKTGVQFKSLRLVKYNERIIEVF